MLCHYLFQEGFEFFLAQASLAQARLKLFTLEQDFPDSPQCGHLASGGSPT